MRARILYTRLRDLRGCEVRVEFTQSAHLGADQTFGHGQELDLYLKSQRPRNKFHQTRLLNSVQNPVFFCDVQLGVTAGQQTRSANPEFFPAIDGGRLNDLIWPESTAEASCGEDELPEQHSPAGFSLQAGSGTSVEGTKCGTSLNFLLGSAGGARQATAGRCGDDVFLFQFGRMTNASDGGMDGVGGFAALFGYRASSSKKCFLSIIHALQQTFSGSPFNIVR
jgi:hypothetical protein